MQTAHPSEAPNVLYYWRIIAKRWLWIAALVCAVTVGSFALSKSSPNYYSSTAVIFPSSSDMRGGMSLSLGGEEGGKGGKEEGGGGGAGLASLLGQGSSTADLLKSILNSRTMADAVIEQLNLKAYYGLDSMEWTRGALKGETTVIVNREKAFFITVESTNPQMAADIANAYVSNLDRLHRMLNVTSVTRNRMFIERRLEEKKQQLVRAEEARKQFQETNKMLLVTDKAQAAMRAAGGIEENILNLEVELATIKEYATAANPVMSQMDAQIQALRRQLDRLQDKQQAQIGISPQGTGMSGARKEGDKALYPPMPELAGLALEYIRLNRELKIHEAIVGMLTGQYEQARIAEARDTPTIQVLDPAIPAEFKSRPRTLHNMQVAALVALLLGCLGALLFEYIARLRNAEFDRDLTLQDQINDPSYTPHTTGGPVGNSQGTSEGNGSAVPEAFVKREPDPSLL